MGAYMSGVVSDSVCVYGWMLAQPMVSLKKENIKSFLKELSQFFQYFFFLFDECRRF